MTRRCRYGPAGAIVAVLSILIAQPAWGHTRSQSFSSWKIDDGSLWMLFRVHSDEVRRLGANESDTSALEALLLRHIGDRIEVVANGRPCHDPDGPRTLAHNGDDLRVVRHFNCPPGGAVSITNNAFFAESPGHVHYARIRTNGQEPVERLFTDTDRTATIAVDAPFEQDSRIASFWRYLLLGVEHILIGVDHLAFLAALLLLCQSLREIVFMVTGFTVGHSITLTLATLGIMEPNIRVIEALIGFTIALVAIENIAVTTGSGRTVALGGGSILAALALIKGTSGIGPPAVTLFGLALFTLCYLLLSDSREAAARLRPVLTLLFGLIHGFGFASVLAEIGLPRDRLAGALFGFNIGVEIGQLGVVALLGVAGAWLRGMSTLPRSPVVGQAISALLCAAGLYWFIQRGYSP